MRNLLPLFAITLFACSAGPSTDVMSDGPERIIEEIIVSGGMALNTVDLGIEGMSCEMMCGGSIKKALAKLPGISGTEIMFFEGEERDHAVVTYDEKLVSDAEMIAAIQALHDGQYKVMSVKITKQVKGSGAPSASDERTEKPTPVSVMSPAKLIVPGILALLSHILRV